MRGASSENQGYENSIKKHKILIKKEANNASEQAYASFRKSISDTSYERKIDEFYNKNKSAPKVSSIEKDDRGYFVIYFNINCNHDFYLFYQDEVLKYLKKNSKLKDLGFNFSVEDYSGIYIE